jgi:hypothetical protein
LAQEGFRNSASKILLYTTTDEIWSDGIHAGILPETGRKLELQ